MRLLILFIFILSFLQANSQDYTIIGKITDSKTGEEISWAWIYEKQDTLNKTFSDNKGYFSINVKDSTSIILIKCLFYKRVEFHYKNDTIDIKLTYKGYDCDAQVYNGDYANVKAKINIRKESLINFKIDLYREYSDKVFNLRFRKRFSKVKDVDSIYFFFDYGFNKQVVSLIYNSKEYKSDSLCTNGITVLAGIICLPLSARGEKVTVYINNHKVKAFRFKRRFYHMHVDFINDELILSYWKRFQVYI